MKLINKIESACVFFNLDCTKTFRSGVTMDMKIHVIGSKHTTANSQHGEPDGKWKIDVIELVDYDVKVGQRKLEGDAVKTFLEGNKAAGVDYVENAIMLIEAEIHILGLDELASQAGVKLIDDPMVVEARAQAKELGHTV